MVVCSEIEVREFLEFVGFLEEEEEEKNIYCIRRGIVTFFFRKNSYINYREEKNYK